MDRACGFGPQGWRFESSQALTRPASSMVEQLPLKQLVTGSNPVRVTMERKGIEPTVVEKSGGRAICNPRFQISYLDQGACNKRPKAMGTLPPTISLSKADSDAWDIRRRLGYS